MNALSIITGLPLSDKNCMVIAQPNHPDHDKMQISLAFELPRNNDLTPITLNWIATHIAPDPFSQGTLLAIGQFGRICSIRDGGYQEGFLDEFVVDGPDTHGELRNIRNIGDSIFAVGMGRQVYERPSSGNWRHVDQGVIVASDSIDVLGFNDIDGVSNSSLYAVGFNGDIWRCTNNHWKQIDSPTNVALYSVAVLDDQTIVAAGQKGTVILGTDTKWIVIDNNVTKEDIWSVVNFKGTIYLASETSIFRLLEDNSIEKVEFISRKITSKVLKTYGGSLWSFGDSDIFKTVDGQNWDTVFSFS